MRTKLYLLGLGVSLTLPIAPTWAAVACRAEYTITDDWGGGFNAALAITNLGSPLDQWQVAWEMPDGQLITQLWNGTLVAAGPQVEVANADWNGTVATDGQFDFGFTGSYSGARNRAPSNISVNGVVCEGQPPLAPPPEPVVACEVEYTIVDQWSDGFTAAVAVHNSGDALNGWQVTWAMPNQQVITHLWNGLLTQTGAQVAVDNESWNGTVASAGVIEFGFNASHSGLNNIPGDIALNGVECAGQVAPPPPPPPACRVDYQILEQWQDGFSAQVEITNTGAPWNGWQTTWTMPAGQQVTDLWNGTLQQEGAAVTVGNLAENRLIPTDGNLSFSFVGSHQGQNPKPIDLAVNGVRCDGQADSVELPPDAPTMLRAELVANHWAQLTWQEPNADETSLVLERQAEGGGWSTLATLPPDTLQYEDHSLAVGVRYDYRLKAVNAAGSSPYTALVSVERQDRNAIATPMLVNNCTICHGPGGVSGGPGVPTIAGLEGDYLLRTLRAYRSGERAASIMGRIARGYDDEQLTRLAAYFASQNFVPTYQPAPQTAVDRGRALHEAGCITCHAGVGEQSAGTGTRLDGQWSGYLHATLAEYAAGHSSNTPPLMASRLAALSSDDLAALAQFYAAPADAKAGGTGGGGGSGGGDPTVAPLPPSLIGAAVVDNAQVNLSWDDRSDNELGFRIERRLSSSAPWAPLVDLAAGSLTYRDTEVTMGASYQYRVLAYNDAGSSEGPSVLVELLTLLDYGAQQYQVQGCAHCHGADGRGGVAGAINGYSASQLATLSDLIHTTMPPTNPAACGDNCALATADYIITTLAESGGGGGPLPACDDTPPAGLRTLRLLTRQEYQNTINDLLGLEVDLIQLMPAENRVNGFDNNTEQNLVTADRLESYVLQADSLAAQAVAERWHQLLPCTSQDSSCAEQFVRQFGLRAYRRPLTESEVQQYQANFVNQPFPDAVETTLLEMLVSPHFLYRSELGELQADGSYQLTPYEVASALAYLFAGTMPDATLMQAAAAGQLATAPQRISQAARLLNTAAGHRQVGNFVGQWLLAASPYALPEKDANAYPAYTAEVRAAMAEELIDFFNHVAFDSSQRFDELFTADYAMVDTTLGSYYGLTGAGSLPSPVAVTDGTRTGIFTLGAVLARYANAAESHPFKRGAFLFRRVLCHNLPPPENNGVVIPPEPDPNATTRERFNFHSSSGESCWSCHQFIDDPGFAFEKYDGAGQFRNVENGHPIDASGLIRGMETFDASEQIPFADLMELSQLTASSQQAAECLATQYYRYATGRQEGSADQCALGSYIEGYAASGYNLNTMLLDIVATPGFTLRRAP